MRADLLRSARVRSVAIQSRVRRLACRGRNWYIIVCLSTAGCRPRCCRQVDKTDDGPTWIALPSLRSSAPCSLSYAPVTCLKVDFGRLALDTKLPKNSWSNLTSRVTFLSLCTHTGHPFTTRTNIQRETLATCSSSSPTNLGSSTGCILPVVFPRLAWLRTSESAPCRRSIPSFPWPAATPVRCLRSGELSVSCPPRHAVV